MHMSDALVSPPVFVAVGAVSLALVGVAVRKVKQRNDPFAKGGSDESVVPLMGVMGAFVFAAQLINFSIPGTGSSGHLIGGVLLAAVLGPWAAFLTLASVLVIQCLAFADGGFMALGCNVFNMAALSCLVAYPLLFRALMRPNASFGRILAASMAASVVGLELGALAVTAETTLSGVTALPVGRFLLFMLPIHLVIGIGEGVATAAVIYVVQRYKPELLMDVGDKKSGGKRHLGSTLAAIAVAALLVGSSFSWVASSNPDGLEWSVAQVSGQEELEFEEASSLHRASASIQQTTALMPDYDTTIAGIVGSGAILLAVFGLSLFFRSRAKRP